MTEDTIDESQVAGEIKPAVDELKGAVSNLAGQVKGRFGEKAQQVRGTVAERADRAGSFAKERVSGAKDNIKTGYDRARKDLDQLGTDVNAYVRDNPGRSVIMAAGLGFVLGLLLRGGDRR